ncbi:MAG: glycosyltransferase family 39 protein [Parafilimonas sp.]
MADEVIKLSYKKNVAILIITATIIRCIIGSGIEFGNDEVYYWTYAQHLQLCYFDHPPLVAFFIRFFTFNLHFNNEIFVRFTAIAGAAINTWLIYKILSRIKNEKAGFYAALLYTACVYTTIISGLFIIPDSPQVVFWLFSVYLLIKIFILKEDQNKNLLLFGLFTGIATLCKIHGVYLWFAGGLFILFFDRAQLKNKYLYISGIITAILISPIFIWNFQNAFITYQYQGGRVVINNGIQLSSFFREIFGEILYCNPVIFVLIVITIFRTIRNRFYTDNKQLFWLLIFLSLPLISVCWSVSLFRDTLPHWPGPAYISLLIFCAYYGGQCFKTTVFFKWIKISNYVVLSIVVLAFLAINYLPLSLGKQNAENLGSGDFTVDLFGWNSFENAFAKLKNNDTATHTMRADAIIISNKWFPAAHLDYYVAHPLNMQLYAFGPLFDIHNFAWLNKQNGAIKKGADAYYISPSNYSSTPDSIYKKVFSVIEPPFIFHQYRNKVAIRNFYVYRMKNYKY